MTSAQAKLFEAFWDQVRNAEQTIRENSHRPPPLDVDDKWNWGLEDSYEAIHLLLISLQRPRLFNAVSALPHRRGPFIADNAHQGLMFQLNPPEAMFGMPNLL